LVLSSQVNSSKALFSLKEATIGETMRRSLLLWTVLFGQLALGQSQDTIAFPMSAAQNMKWLQHLQETSDSMQWSLIKARLFPSPARAGQREDNHTPLLIIDGIPIALSLIHI